MPRRQDDPPNGHNPPGLGFAVVFDWALTAQLLTQAVAGELRLLRLEPDRGPVAGRVAGAAAMLLLGEAVRRRQQWARMAQIVLCLAVTLGGVVSGVSLIGGRTGRAAVLSLAIMLTIAPWIVVRLSSADARAYFLGSSGRAPASRTGGVWLRLMALQAVIWGIAVALSQAL